MSPCCDQTERSNQLALPALTLAGASRFSVKPQCGAERSGLYLLISIAYMYILLLAIISDYVPVNQFYINKFSFKIHEVKIV